MPEHKIERLRQQTQQRIDEGFVGAAIEFDK